MDIDKIVQLVLENLKVKNDNLLVYHKEDIFNSLLQNFNIDYEVYNNNDNIDKFNKLVITKLTTKELYNISVGVPNCELSKVVLDFLLKGREVFILREALEYRAYKYTSNKNLYELYEGYLNTLISFSIKVVNRDEFLQNIYKVVNNEAYFKGNLLKDIDIHNFYSQDYKKILINKNCKVTDLAKDTAREYNLSIVKLEE